MTKAKVIGRYDLHNSFLSLTSFLIRRIMVYTMEGGHEQKTED